MGVVVARLQRGAWQPAHSACALARVAPCASRASNPHGVGAARETAGMPRSYRPTAAHRGAHRSLRGTHRRGIKRPMVGRNHGRTPTECAESESGGANSALQHALRRDCPGHFHAPTFHRAVRVCTASLLHVAWPRCTFRFAMAPVASCMTQAACAMLRLTSRTSRDARCEHGARCEPDALRCLACNMNVP